MAAQASVDRAASAPRSIASAVLFAWGWVVLFVGAPGLLGGCAGPARAPSVTAVRISELTDVGDARHRASMGLVLEGLDAELASSPQRALSRYERAIRVDPSNAFAYLTLARYYAARADSERTLQYLDRAQSLIDPSTAIGRDTEPHLLGLRGWALVEAGQSAEAEPLLAEAGRLAPAVWADGRLDAIELR